LVFDNDQISAGEVVFDLSEFVQNGIKQRNEIKPLTKCID